MKIFRGIVLCICLMLPFPNLALAATLGPAHSYSELLQLMEQAADGDTLLVEGELSAAGYDPLSTERSLTIASAGSETAAIRELRLHNARIQFSNVELLDSLTITGTSFVELGDDVTVRGASGKSGVSFVGNGELLIDRRCSIIGGSKSDGVSVSQQEGSLYIGVEGSVKGGTLGGTGMTISPLEQMGTMMISGSVSGGDSTAIGGHALNLYNLSGNAFVTINGTITGGPGSVGGDGIQLVDVTDSVNIGVDGVISGGKGEEYGGDALMLLNVGGASSIHLSGSLTGGDVTTDAGQPGTSLLVVGERASIHTQPEAILLSGNAPVADASVTPSAEPTVTPLPEIPTSVSETDAIAEPEAPDISDETAQAQTPVSTEDSMSADTQPDELPAEQPEATQAEAQI